jgi:hypothetical protein
MQPSFFSFFFNILIEFFHDENIQNSIILTLQVLKLGSLQSHGGLLNNSKNTTEPPQFKRSKEFKGYKF